jgi:hypothetical protein
MRRAIMPPSKKYMLNRALQELDAVLSNDKMSASEMKHCVTIAVDEIRNVLAVLKDEDDSK